MLKCRERSYLFVLFGFRAISLTSCSRAPDYWTEAKPSQKKILVSFPPLYCFAHAVAGDEGFVLLVTNTGPHEYEGTQTDIFKVNKADLYIYNGLTLDDNFTDRMLRGHTNRNLKTLNVGSVMLEKDKPLPNDDTKNRLIIKGKQVSTSTPMARSVHGEDPHTGLAPWAKP